MNNYPYGNNQNRDMDSTIPATPFNPAAAQQQAYAAPQPMQPAPQPVMPPPPVVPQPVAQQPYGVPVAPVAPAAKGEGFLKKNLMGILVAASGMASIAFGIGGILESNNVFSMTMVSRQSEMKSFFKLVDGPAPALGIVMVILGLLFGAAAVVLGILFSNKETEEGSPKSLAFKVGMILGAVGVLLFMFAIFATSCSACSYCSLKP